MHILGYLSLCAALMDSEIIQYRRLAGIYVPAAERLVNIIAMCKIQMVKAADDCVQVHSFIPSPQKVNQLTVNRLMDFYFNHIFSHCQCKTGENL